MQKLFILGAGFSKAFSSYMPTIYDLGQTIKNNINRIPGNSENRGIYRKLSSNPEQLLSYLFQPMPWKTPEKVYLDKSAFSFLSRFIADYISECERLAFGNETPSWGGSFVEYITKKKLTVATLNYDTILEKLYLNLQIPDKSILGKGYEVQKVTILDLYPLPVVNILERKLHTTVVLQNPSTFKLLKLHGSINWYYSGDENFPGQQIYAEDYATVSMHENKIEMLKTDLVPLLIPPVTEKTFFYGTNLIKAAWRSLLQAIKLADEIYCIGYSLPKTDSTMKLFLSTAATTYNSKKIYIVNSAKDEELEILIDNYSEVFGIANLKEDYLGQDNCVEMMINNL